MSSPDDYEPSRSGAQLYALLPAIYRTRDGAELEPQDGQRDLERFLDGFGELFDDLRGLVERQLADAFPDDRPSSLGPSDDPPLAQSWLLPYFGGLVDARMVSPDPASQRAEVGSAVRWRQRKGTLVAAEEITREVGQVSAVLHEGWQRVAVSPRIGGTRQLPVTVDFRRQTRAVRATIDRADARFTHFDGVERAWAVDGLGGVPRHRDSYQDLSLRTPELRRAEPRHRRGLVHPKRLLAWITPEQSLFGLPTMHMSWAQFVGGGDGARSEIGEPSATFVSQYAGEIEITDGVVTLDEALPYHLEGLSFQGELRVTVGSLSLRGVRTPLLVLEEGAGGLDGRDCLFGELRAGGRAIALDGCTVLGPTTCARLEAVDSLLVGVTAGEEGGGQVVMDATFVRCGIGEAILGPDATLSATVTDVAPEFLSTDFSSGLCGGLHPRTSELISLGGRGGRELGRFHRGRAGRPLVVGALDLGELPERDLGQPHHVMRDIVVTGALRWTCGTLALERVAAMQLLGPVEPAGDDLPARVLDARSSLFETVAAIGSELRLEYCTLMQFQSAGGLLGSDCIIAGGLPPAPESTVRLRWSRVPPSWDAGSYHRCHDEDPRFIGDQFGAPFHGLLLPDGSKQLSQGAEDGGELGAYHDAHWCLRVEGVARKLREHLPLGIEPVLIPDPHLTVHPPLVSEEP